MSPRPAALTASAPRVLLIAVVAAFAALALHPAAGLAACANPVACENAKTGSAPTTWQVSGSGDATIQGYATAMSVNHGQTIRLKVKTTATAYHIDIYRLGWYQGNGARLQAGGIRPTASLPQSQPACLTDAATGLVDCGNWAPSASWAVPADAVSGVYIARLIRDDNGGASQIPFVVRDDEGSSEMLVKTSDATWQAYNKYGGNSLYSCTVACPPGNPNAYKAALSVSYNRPFDGTITQDNGRSYLYYAEYQLIRFVERNGYDISYTSQPDVDTSSALLKNHKLLISSAHDEYWSAGERANVEAARDAGVNLAFFSGNEVFWKTRWGASSADGTATPYRTLTSYKDTHFDAAADPVTWTGTWRDGRFAAPPNGGRPENSLTGQLFIVNSGAADITVPSQYKDLRLWRNTPVASLGAGQSRTLLPGGNTLGFEWDIDVDNGFRPAGQVALSSTTVSGVESFTDFGTFTQQNTTQTHHLTMYRAPSGARVFGAGTVQWAWGLDTTNAWNNSGPIAASPDPVMQQATVNLFADMGQTATTLMAGLTPASPSTDTIAPNSAIASPAGGAALTDGSRVTISGTATDAGGTVAGVEVSTDGGATWHPATGTSSWSYSWLVHGAPTAKILARATDDSGNIESSSQPVTVNVACPCMMAGPSVTPWTVDQGDPSAVEVGVRFKSDMDGTITGVRFYKATANTGAHVGNLWTANGTLLARGTFSGESPSGWQQLNFQTPVSITAGTTYVASYFAPSGHYSASSYYFHVPSPVGGSTLDSPPLHAISANTGGSNGVYSYAGSTTFPASTYHGENYAVDVLFNPNLAPGVPSLVSATAGAESATVTFQPPTTGGAPARYIVTPYLGSTAQPSVTVTGSPPATSVYVNGLTAGASYTFTVQAANTTGAGPVSGNSNPVVPSGATVPGAPTGVSAAPGNGQATVRWTAPSDGGRTITSYIVTPSINGAAQTPTTVTGSPAPATAVVPGLANGTSYTFTVRAANSVGAGPDSTASTAVTPNPGPRFVQRVSARALASTLQLTPASPVTAGDRLIVMAGVWSAGKATISGVTDSAGNTYTRVASVTAAEDTQLSVWTAPVTAGGGTRPTITVTAGAGADIGGAALEYANMSPAAGAAAVDVAATATGTAVTSDFVSSGPTAAVTADSELALGFYADSGFSRALSADPNYTERVNVSPTPDMEFVVEDAPANRGDTPAARVSTGANTPWTMATVVFKNAPPATPALSVTPTALAFSATEGGASPAAKTLSISNSGGGTLSWTASESATWLSLSPAGGTNAGTVTVTPDITGLAAGTYTTNITVTATGASGSPTTIPVTFTVSPPPPVLTVSPTSLSFNGTAGGASPAAKTVDVSNTGGGTMSWTASESVSWLSLSPASGTNTATITATPDSTGLAAGSYTTNITITATGATGSPKTVPVTFTVDPPNTPPSLAVTPASLAFSATQGGTNPAAKTVSVSNTGGGTMAWTASDDAAWMTVSPTSATNNGTVTVTPDVSGLAAGTYTGVVTIDAGTTTGSPKTVAVTLTVDPPPPPALSVSPSALTFNATQGATNPAAQSLSVSNTGSGSLAVSAADDASWLTVTPATATAPASLSVAASITGLAPGTYTATVTVTATTAGAQGSPKTVGVTLNVAAPATGLVGAWGFDETSGASTSDASGNGNAGTISAATRTAAGKFGGALSFNGTNSWVTVPDSNSLDLTTGMTLEAWVRPDVAGSLWRCVLLKEQSASLIYALYAADGTGRPAADVFTTADRGLSGTSPTLLNAWTHLAATYDRTTLRLYVNGTQVATRAVTGSITTSTGALRIGGNSSWTDEWFSGLIDEVRVYNRTLTATEIQADMARPVSGA